MAVAPWYFRMMLFIHLELMSRQALVMILIMTIMIMMMIIIIIVIMIMIIIRMTFKGAVLDFRTSFSLHIQVSAVCSPKLQQHSLSKHELHIRHRPFAAGVPGTAQLGILT